MLLWNSRLRGNSTGGNRGNEGRTNRHHAQLRHFPLSGGRGGLPAPGYGACTNSWTKAPTKRNVIDLPPTHAYRTKAARKDTKGISMDTANRKTPQAEVKGQGQPLTLDAYAGLVHEPDWADADIYRAIVVNLPRELHGFDAATRRRVLRDAPPLTGTPWDALLAATAETRRPRPPRAASTVDGRTRTVHGHALVCKSETARVALASAVLRTGPHSYAMEHRSTPRTSMHEAATSHGKVNHERIEPKPLECGADRAARHALATIATPSERSRGSTLSAAPAWRSHTAGDARPGTSTHASTPATGHSEIEALPMALRARLIRLLEVVENVGLEALRAPHVRHLDGKLWELRVRAERGIARGIHVTVAGRRVVVLHRVREEVAPGARDRPGTDEAGDAMTKLKDVKARFMEDSAFREEYARIDEEYALIEALVRARTAAKLTQTELARRLGTTQSAVARLEGGRVSPSFATLRRYAEATGTRLSVDLVPFGG